MLQPRFLPGLTLSMDRYHVKVKDAIGPPGTVQNIVNACKLENNPFACSVLEFRPTEVIYRSPPINSQLLEVKGLDFEGNYTESVGAGRFSLRLLANYLESQTSGVPGSALVNRAGEQNNPKWRGTLRGSYAQGPFRMSLGARYIGPTKFNVTFVEGQDINDNSIPAVTYFDTQVAYTIGGSRIGEMEIYANVQNLLNKEPPTVMSSFTYHIISETASIFDVVGRFFTIGVKLRR